jgi:TRAP-type mannitol/chloroaromatic compound transport system permease small subunit
MERFLNALIERLLAVVKWLALPVAALLCLQWPLREVIQAGSREANDLGQWLFAIFVAASVVAATRANAHLASDTMAQRYTANTRARFAMYGIAAAVVPWVAFVLWSGTKPIVASVAGLERFPDTGNFGYFILKLALILLITLMALQAVVDVARWVSARRGRP